MSLGLNPYPSIDSSDVVLEPIAQIHPWRRYFARRADYFLFMLAAAAAGELVGYPITADNQGIALLLQIALSVAWIPFEAVLLSGFGATPGKMLLGLEVRTAAGARLSFTQALSRSAVVAVAGVGCGIGLISLICMWRSWNHLASTGSTVWDDSEGHQVLRRDVPWWHLGAGALCALLIALLLYVNGVLIIPFLAGL